MKREYFLTAGELAGLVLLNDTLEEIMAHVWADLSADLRQETEAAQDSLQGILNRLHNVPQRIGA